MTSDLPHSSPARRTRANLTRRESIALLGSGLFASCLGGSPRSLSAARLADKHESAIKRGLDWVARTQSKLGHWTAQTYPTAMTALAGTALLCSGSTTTQGPYARHIRRAVDYLMGMARPNGLIGDPIRDNRYTYGHGFSMLFLSQVLGEEEDLQRREELMAMLEKAVEFSGRAQTKSGGWGYVSAADGNDFDEGSTTITQVQGLRGCRNAGVPVAVDIINAAKQYIYQCKNPDGGISYSSRNRGSSRPAITAAALAALYNAGDYDSDHVPDMLDYCKKNLYRISGGTQHFGHWHYAYLYYAQVVYREGGTEWETFRNTLYDRLAAEQASEGSWKGDQIGEIYITSINLTIMQLERGFLPIYQR
jgi:hypothetical protein